MSEVYDADYYLRGVESGKSLYQNYRYLPTMTRPMVQQIVEHCGITKQDQILDFGCARGYVVRAFRELGYEAYGLDVSEWAIKNCDPLVKEFVTDGDRLGQNSSMTDWIIAKDVLEHVLDVQATIDDLMEHARKGVFAVVPLSLFDGQPYVVKSYERDITHLHRLCLGTWAGMFMRPGWEVKGSYRLPGVKDNYYTAEWERGNGFLVARRQP